MSAQEATTPSTRAPPSADTPTDFNNHFTASGKAVVEWESPGLEPQCLVHPDPRTRHIVFEACLEKDGSQCFAFFRLRIPVRHMHLHDIVLYIHIPPDHISSFEWTFGYDAAKPAVQSKLSNDPTRLCFHLQKPVQVIVPDQVPLKSKKPATAAIIQALESLTMASIFSVYLEHTTLSKPRLCSIAEAIKSGLSRPVPRYGHLHRLYKGMGGTILSLDATQPHVVAGPSGPPPSGAVHQGTTDSEVPEPPTRADSPPSYDGIGDGPPMPPVENPETSKRQRKRRRQCSASSTQSDEDVLSPRPMKWTGVQSPGLANEKATTSASAPTGSLATTDNTLFVPPWAQSLLADVAVLKGTIAKQQVMIQDLQSQVAKLEDEAGTQEEEYAALERRMDQAEADIVDLDDTAREHGETLEALEDGIATIQEDLDPARRASELEQMREDVRVEIMARLRGALDSP